MPASPFAYRLSSRMRLGEYELGVISDLHLRRRKYATGSHLVMQGDRDQSGFVLASGWAIIYKTQPDGERQIVNFKLPGDFVGVRAMMFRSADLSAEAITPIEASEVTKDQLFNVFTQTHLLAAAVLWAVTHDDAMIVERLVGMGQRSAGQRVAHLLLELEARLELVGMASKSGFHCPITQYHLADSLGLTPVHINRVLRNIRLDGLVTFQQGLVTFHNYAGLVEFANFDPGYLDHGDPLPPAECQTALAPDGFQMAGPEPLNRFRDRRRTHLTIRKSQERSVGAS
jgi:CRP-like cAMP-binding protein